mmetsp:Transcript_13400/g.52475  ORF Transcript_13400/g.52475 Transcript_13400/m.52475 type:complete len:88 (-) Transcript_13400:3130-3393(-)
MTKRAAESSPELATGEDEVVMKARGPGRPKKEPKKAHQVADGKASERVASFGSPPPTAIGSGGGIRSGEEHKRYQVVLVDITLDRLT